MTDCMTEEMTMPKSIEEFLVNKCLSNDFPYLNEVMNVDKDICMKNCLY